MEGELHLTGLQQSFSGSSLNSAWLICIHKSNGYILTRFKLRTTFKVIFVFFNMQSDFKGSWRGMSPTSSVGWSHWYLKCCWDFTQGLKGNVKFAFPYKTPAPLKGELRQPEHLIVPLNNVFQIPQNGGEKVSALVVLELYGLLAKGVTGVKCCAKHTLIAK